jgi:serine protease Do
VISFSGDSINMNINDYQDSRPPRRAQGWARSGRGTAVAAALLLTGSIVGWTASSKVGLTASAAPAPTAAAVPAPPAPGSYAGVVDHVTPAVVTIRMERRVQNVSQDIPEEFRQFFGDQFGFGRRGPQQPERREGGLGSGVVVRPDGYILTNNHVVDHADQLSVELNDGGSFKAKLVGTDAATDLAVVKIEGTKLPTLPLGDSDAVRVGDVVLAIGNPLGVGQTVTMGIVSAKGRATEHGDNSYEDFIQTDAPINQGNSGGALVNTRGELVGINSQILTPSGGNIGIGFAIPANMAKNVMTQLIDHGQVHRGMIGVTIQPVTSDIASSLGLSQVRGALVNSVQSGSPADKAGIRRGDVITSVNGAAVKDSNDLRNNVGQMAPGSTAKLTVVRDGKEQTFDVTLAERQATGSEAEEGNGGSGRSGTFGMSVEPLTRDRAQALGMPMESGVVVAEVQAGGRAADAGLRPGDVITEVDRKPVNSPDALRAALKDGTKPALLLVHRGQATVYVTIDRQ